MTSRLFVGTAGAVVAFGALALAPEAAQADPPFLTFQYDVTNDGQEAETFNWNQYGNSPVFGDWNVPGAGQGNPWHGWNYNGQLAEPGNWEFEWLTVFDAPGQGGAAAGGGGGSFVTANIVVTNNDPSTQNFSLLMTLPVLQPITSPVERGSIVGTVTDLTFDSATVSAPSGGRIYTPLIDGVEESPGFLMVDPFSESAGPLGSESVGPQDFGVPSPVAATQDVDDTIGIFLNFDLSGGDSASFTAIFEVIPGPGGLPVLAAFGLLAGRRRRRR